MMRWEVSALAAAGLVGVGVCTAASPHPLRASVSFLAGLLLAATILAISGSAVRWAARRTPVLSMAVALGSYSATVWLFAIVLVASSPRVVDAAPFAGGLVISVVIGVVRYAHDARVRVNG